MNSNKIQDQERTETIKTRRSLFDLRFKDFWGYRDFNYLIFFEVRILIIATLIIYLIKYITSEHSNFAMANPFIAIAESFSWSMFINSFTFMTFLICSGILIFKKVEQSFMHTV